MVISQRLAPSACLALVGAALPRAYLIGHHPVDGLAGQHDAVLMVLNDDGLWAGQPILCIAEVVLDQHAEVAEHRHDLLHQHVCAVVQERVVGAVERDVVWVPPARAVACGGSGVSLRRTPSWGQDGDRTCSRLGWEGQAETVEGPAVWFPGHSEHLGPRGHAPLGPQRPSFGPDGPQRPSFGPDASSAPRSRRWPPSTRPAPAFPGPWPRGGASRRQEKRLPTGA